MTTMAHGQTEHEIAAGRARENVITGASIVRHRRSSRLIHWSVAATFFLALLSGMPIWSPLFGWMASLLGGMEVCRWLHPYAGSLFFILSTVQFFHWLGDMRLTKGDRSWFGPKAFKYMHHEEFGADPGKYNGGQKLFFWAVTLGAIGLLLSGLIMWFPLYFPQMIRELAILLHDITFILFLVAVITHIYLGTAAEPGTFRAMTRGTVTRAWARLHHPGWFQEVTGEEARKR
ncbi:MAG TPA: formate dehydrogenase subunit gamma [Thermoanaerobaculia bacterium]|jgi:formate dehydrogenase subunit gamma|nr:formate dehydrogenase subunit gamma [Thermoanaerobaculia bacterium]